MANSYIPSYIQYFILHVHHRAMSRAMHVVASAIRACKIKLAGPRGSVYVRMDTYINVHVLRTHLA